MHKSSFQAMEKFKDNYLDINKSLKILDIGSYDSSGTSYNYGRFLKEKNWEYFGMDIQKGSNVDIVVSDIYNWVEIEDVSFDVVVSGQAFEHMEFFWKAIEEVERILKPGGFCCIIAPSDGPVHKNPYDCFRFKENGLREIANYVGFEILECYVNNDEISYPWYDCVLIAKKINNLKCNNLYEKMDDLEYKFDLLLKEINK